MDDYVCGFDYVLVSFGRKFGFGRFWPKPQVLVNFDWKHWFLTEETGFWSILAEKAGFGRF